jgi:hypothetical protein
LPEDVPLTIKVPPEAIFRPSASEITISFTETLVEEPMIGAFVTSGINISSFPGTPSVQLPAVAQSVLDEPIQVLS